MIFNPPPNWPRFPKGWTPPPGWQPDPSWPPPPYGWALWINPEGGTAVTTPVAAAASSKPLPWYRRTITISLLLVFFFPVGLVLLWLRPDWSVRRRGIITGLVAAFVIFAMLGSNPPPPTTIQVSPAAGGSSSSPTPGTVTSAATTTPSAEPSPASSSPSAPSPSTSSASPVAVQTTHLAAAPAPTSAAPVYTTKTSQAPQPVQTTAQTQSCYPTTSTGNCYKPGEYCRTADHGRTGIDAYGDPIKCEDNNGWRWERI